MLKTRNLTLALLLVATLGFGCRIAFADTYQSFDLAWSGASFNNTATASGTAVIDTTVLPDYTSTVEPLNPANVFQSLSITIAGAGAGDGTFTLSDFTGANNMNWSTNGGTLNFSKPLIGQPTNNAPWGTLDYSGAGYFNLFSNGNDPAAPYGVDNFLMGTDDGSVLMQLTAFSPVVPEPSPLLLLGSGLAGLALIGLMRRRAMAAAEPASCA